MIKQVATIIAVAAGSAALAACSAGQPPAQVSSVAPASASAAKSHGLIAGAIDDALQRAEVKLTTGDISLSDTGNIGISDRDNGAPEAKITPRGDLVIAGKPVDLNAGQRADVLAYRQQLISVARQGIEVGKQGAALGMSAARAAIAGVFSGESEQQVRARVEGKASGIRRAAMEICNRLPALMAEQQKLADAVPEFRPYAGLTQARIDECRTDALRDHGTDRAATRDRVRQGVRSGIQAATQAAGLASRSAPDASGKAASASSADR